MRALLIGVGVVALAACKDDAPRPKPAGPPAPPRADQHADAVLAKLPASAEPCEGQACVLLAMKAGDANVPQALALLRRGCETADGAACAMIAVAYDQGNGVPADPVTASVLYDRSCARGYAKGCYNLGLMLANGEGVPADMRRAIALFDQACTAGAWRSCGTLGDYYVQQGDKIKARPVLELGCKNGDQLSCETLPKLD